MKGTIARFKSVTGLKNKRKGGKPKKSAPSYRSRNYSGTRGAIKDIEEGR